MTLVNRMVTGAYYVPGHNVTLVNRLVTGAYYVPGHNVTLVNKMVTDAYYVLDGEQNGDCCILCSRSQRDAGEQNGN